MRLLKGVRNLVNEMVVKEYSLTLLEMEEDLEGFGYRFLIDSTGYAVMCGETMVKGRLSATPLSRDDQAMASFVMDALRAAYQHSKSRTG